MQNNVLTHYLITICKKQEEIAHIKDIAIFYAPSQNKKIYRPENVQNKFH